MSDIIIDPNDSSKVIIPMSVDAKDLERKLLLKRGRLQQAQALVDELPLEIADEESQLDAIYKQMPDMKPLEDNQ